MCGIIYLKRLDRKSAEKGVWKRYEKQKSRGSDGFGYLAINGKIKAIRRTREADIRTELAKEKADEILFHHRFPTSVPNIEEGAHPLEIENKLLAYKYYVVHNGVLRNDDELKKKHEKMGFEYQTEIEQKIVTKQKEYSYGKKWNDSEAFAIELALAIEGKQEKVEAEGACAFVALQVDKNQKQVKLFFGRNEGNPLKSYRARELWSLTSEGMGTEITAHTLYAYDYATGKVTEKPLEIGTKAKMELPNTSWWERYGIGDNRYHAVLCPCSLCDRNRKYDEDDFELMDTPLELKEEREMLMADLKKAQEKSDYDEQMELETELDFIDEQLANYGYGKKQRVVY